MSQSSASHTWAGMRTGLEGACFKALTWGDSDQVGNVDQPSWCWPRHLPGQFGEHCAARGRFPFTNIWICPLGTLAAIGAQSGSYRLEFSFEFPSCLLFWETGWHQELSVYFCLPDSVTWVSSLQKLSVPSRVKVVPTHPLTKCVLILKRSGHASVLKLCTK